MTTQVPVFLSVDATATTVRRTPRPALLIDASNVGWNDFGYKMRVTARVLGSSARKLDHLLMFEGESDTYAFLKKQIPANEAVPFESFDHRFCSLFANLRAYRTLVEEFGLDATVDLLQQVGDATVLRDRTDDPRNELLATEQFHLGVLREPEAYRAYRRGASLLKDRPGPPAEDASSTFKATCALPPKWQKTSVTFDFSSDVFMRERIAVLIGPNGTGKSSLLVRVAETLMVGSPLTGADEPEAVINDEPERAELVPIPHLNGLIVLSSAPSDKYRQIRQTTVGPDFWSFMLIEPPPEDFDPLTAQLIDVLRDRETLVHGGEGRKSLTRRDLLSEVLTELRVWEDVHIPIIAKYASGLSTREYDGVDYISLKKLRAEKRSLAATRSADISKRPVHIGAFGKRDLSSGELAMFRFAVQLISTIEVGCLVIMDEPETHLHPQFIARMIETLDIVLKATKSCAIIATHSPFIVREVPRKRVQVLATEDGQTVAQEPRLQTFGAGIDAISDAVFGDSRREHLHEKLLDNWLHALGGQKMSIDEVIEHHALDLNPEMLSYLARRIDGGRS